MRADPPTIGLIGCGRWGSLILRDLLTIGVAVDVMVPRSDRNDELFAAGARRVVHRVDELTGVDGFVVAAPTSVHADVLDQVVDLGVPVFVEKPMTSDAVRAASLAARAPDSLFVMDKWRYHPGVMLMRERVAAGAIGVPVGIRTRRVQWGSPHDDVDCAWILLPHDLSIATEVFGALPRPTAARAHLDGERLLGLHGIADYPNGMWMTFEVGITAPDAERRIEVIGDEATLILAGGWSEEIVVIRHATREPEPQLLPATGELPLLAELRSFIGHVLGGPAPRSSAQDGADTVAAVAAFREMAGLDSPWPAST